MAKTKRLCRREARRHGLPGIHNYHSDRAHQKARKRRKLQKAGRKAARRKG